MSNSAKGISKPKEIHIPTNPTLATQNPQIWAHKQKYQGNNGKEKFSFLLGEMKRKVRTNIPKAPNSPQIVQKKERISHQNMKFHTSMATDRFKSSATKRHARRSRHTEHSNRRRRVEIIPRAGGAGEEAAGSSPEDVDAEVEREVDEELVEVAEVSGVAVGVEHGGCGVRVSHVHRGQGVAPPRAEAQHLDVLPVRLAAERGDARRGVLRQRVRRRRRREEGHLRRHARRHPSHLCYRSPLLALRFLARIGSWQQVGKVAPFSLRLASGGLCSFPRARWVWYS
jgi:hypothetical protein